MRDLDTYCRSLERQKELMSKLLGKQRDEHEKTRRRLLVKLLLERARVLRLKDHKASAARKYKLADRYCANAIQLRRLATSIQNGDPLAYFARLADTHDLAGELKPKLRKKQRNTSGEVTWVDCDRCNGHDLTCVKCAGSGQAAYMNGRLV